MEFLHQQWYHLKFGDFMFKIVALSGRKGSGKSEISSKLINDGFIKISFADWMKQKLSIFFDIDIKYFYDFRFKESKLEEIGLDPINWNIDLAKKFSSFIDEEFNLNKTCHITTLRQLMQFVGTELLRDKDIFFHIKKTLSNLDENKKYVCDDLRFKNELDYLRSFTKSLTAVYISRPFNWENISNHESEIDLKWNNFSNIIFNIYDSADEFINKNYFNILNNKFNNDFNINIDSNINAFNSYSNVLTEHLIVAFLHKTKQLGYNFINNTLYFDKYNAFNWLNSTKKSFYLSHSNINLNLSYNFSKENYESLFLLENLKLWNDSNLLLNKLPLDIKNEYISELNLISQSN